MRWRKKIFHCLRPAGWLGVFCIAGLSDVAAMGGFVVIITKNIQYSKRKYFGVTFTLTIFCQTPALSIIVPLAKVENGKQCHLVADY